MHKKKYIGNSISSNIYNSIKNKNFVVGFVGTVITILLSSIDQIVDGFRLEELLGYGFHHYMILNALTSNAMTLVLPIVAALPFTASFLDDYKSGFIKEYLPRTNVAGYLGGKIAGCVISGGLVLVAGVFMAYIVAALMFTPMEAVASSLQEPLFPEILGKLGLFFCAGAFWALVGMLFATLTGSRYMAYASPFVVYYVLIILYERYFDKMYVLYPKEWIAPSAKWIYGNAGVVIFLIELIILAAIGCGIAMRRKIRNI